LFLAHPDQIFFLQPQVVRPGTSATNTLRSSPWQTRHYGASDDATAAALPFNGNYVEDTLEVEAANAFLAKTKAEAEKQAKLDSMLAAAQAAATEAHQEMLTDEQALVDAEASAQLEQEAVDAMAAELAEQAAVQRMTMAMDAEAAGLLAQNIEEDAGEVHDAESTDQHAHNSGEDTSVALGMARLFGGLEPPTPVKDGGDSSNSAPSASEEDNGGSVSDYTVAATGNSLAEEPTTLNQADDAEKDTDDDDESEQTETTVVNDQDAGVDVGASVHAYVDQPVGVDAAEKVVPAPPPSQPLEEEELEQAASLSLKAMGLHSLLLQHRSIPQDASVQQHQESLDTRLHDLNVTSGEQKPDAEVEAKDIDSGEEGEVANLDTFVSTPKTAGHTAAKLSAEFTSPKLAGRDSIDWQESPDKTPLKLNLDASKEEEEEEEEEEEDAVKVGAVNSVQPLKAKTV
jgi:hypothetical protein